MIVNGFLERYIARTNHDISFEPVEANSAWISPNIRWKKTWKLSPRINFGCLGRKMLRRDDNVLQSYEIVIYFLK